MSSASFDDGTLATSIATVGPTPLLDCAADSKSGRCDNALVTTLSRLGLFCTEKLYSTKKDSHLAILWEQGAGYLRPCLATHGPYRPRTVDLLGDRHEI